jgi:HEPN domain-containing protein
MSRAVEQWVERAQYDIETARAMLKACRYLYVFFCCQQAVEKMLKALVAQETNEFPPRTHNLAHLAGLARVPPGESRLHLFRTLTDFYIGSRYPREVEQLRKRVNPAKAERVLKATEKVLQWLASKLQ